jgi:hypothetical protein
VESDVFFDDAQIRKMQHDFLKQGMLLYAEGLKAKVNQIKRGMRAPAFSHLAGIEENVGVLARNSSAKGAGSYWR